MLSTPSPNPGPSPRYQRVLRRWSELLLGVALLFAAVGGYICFSPVPGTFTFSWPGVYCMAMYALLMVFAFRAQRIAYPPLPIAKQRNVDEAGSHGKI